MRLAIMLVEVVAVNTTKTELMPYNLAIIFAVDTIRSSAGWAYFVRVVNYKTCACDHQEGPVVIQTENLNKF